MQDIQVFQPVFERETAEHIHYNGNHDGHPLRIVFDKKGARFLINGDDVARAMGYKDALEMMGSDESLDTLNELKQRG